MAEFYKVSKDELQQLASKIRNLTGLTNELSFPTEFETSLDQIKQTAPRGSSWEEKDIGNFQQITSLEYANGLWVIGTSNGIYYSADDFLNIYPTAISGTNITSVCFQGKYWFAASVDCIYYSFDGTTWSSNWKDDLYKNVMYMTSNEGIVLALANNSENNVKIYKWDITWSSIAEGISWDFLASHNIAYGNGTWLIPAKETIYRLTNRGNIVEAITPGWAGVNYYNVCYGKGIWVASASGAIVYSLDDGISWQIANIDTPIENGAYQRFGQIEYHNGKWVVAANPTSGQGTGLLYSIDGINWFQSNLITYYTQNIDYTANRWVISVYDYESSTRYDDIYYSDDGQVWHLAKMLEGNNYPPELTHSDNLWVVTVNNSSLINGNYVTKALLLTSALY